MTYQVTTPLLKPYLGLAGPFLLLLGLYVWAQTIEVSSAALSTEQSDLLIQSVSESPYNVVRKVVRIDTVYGRRTLYTGEDENYRVRVKPGATWPIAYRWRLGDGTRTIGNNVVHHYDQPGLYRLHVLVSNRYGSDSTSIWIRVLEERPIVAVPPSPLSIGATSTDGEEEELIEGAVLQNSVVQDDTYYSWMVETHLNRMGAESAAQNYSELGLEQVRVFVDTSGKGSTAYRVLVGHFRMKDRALREKRHIKDLTKRPVILITIRI